MEIGNISYEMVSGNSVENRKVLVTWVSEVKKF